MRLTEDWQSGDWYFSPQAKLDVAGTIRAQRFLVVKPGQTGQPGGRVTQRQPTDSAQHCAAAGLQGGHDRATDEVDRRP